MGCVVPNALKCIMHLSSQMLKPNLLEMKRMRATCLEFCGVVTPFAPIVLFKWCLLMMIPSLMARVWFDVQLMDKSPDWMKRKERRRRKSNNCVSTMQWLICSTIVRLLHSCQHPSSVMNAKKLMQLCTVKIALSIIVEHVKPKCTRY